MIELWKDIEGYEGHYQVSNKGIVRSLNRVSINSYQARNLKGKILAKRVTKHKYHRVALYKDNKQHSFAVHRLVAQAFIPNPLKKPQVNHIDSDKQNNKLDNLEWCTNGENQIHAYVNGRHPNSLSIVQVKKIRALYLKGTPQAGIASKFNIHQSQVSKIVNYKRWAYV